MGDSEQDLPVKDDDIETIEEWREAISDFLGKMYAMRMLCEIDVYSGTRFVDIRDAFVGSSSTLSTRKDRAVELYLIEPVVKDADDGYGTHTYYQFTQVGRHIRAELERQQVARLHQKLKPLEHQMKDRKKSIENWASDIPADPLVVYYGDYDP